MAKKIKIRLIGGDDASFTASSGFELRLKATATAVHASLDLNALGDCTTVWSDDDDAVAEAAELRRLLEAIYEGEKARHRLLHMAAKHERHVLDYLADRDAGEDEEAA